MYLGATNGTRTHECWSHNPVCCSLKYANTSHFFALHAFAFYMNNNPFTLFICEKNNPKKLIPFLKSFIIQVHQKNSPQVPPSQDSVDVKLKQSWQAGPKRSGAEVSGRMFSHNSDIKRYVPTHLTIVRRCSPGTGKKCHLVDQM